MLIMSVDRGFVRFDLSLCLVIYVNIYLESRVEGCSLRLDLCSLVYDGQFNPFL